MNKLTSALLAITFLSSLSAVQAEPCKIKRHSNGYFYVYAGSSVQSGGYSNPGGAINEAHDLKKWGICSYMESPIRYKCEVKRFSNGYFYVKRNGNTWSGGYSTVGGAGRKMQEYVNQRLCLSDVNGGGTTTAPRRDHGTHHHGLGFNFRDRALWIATMTINVTKALEPYVNNAQEEKLDQIKKQATRLRARINGGRDIKIVRNTIYTLGRYLDEASWMVNLLYETDALDSHAEELDTARESITTMVDFLDHTFAGSRTELY